MATTKSLTSLEKSKEAVLVIKEKLLPVLRLLTDDKFGEATGRAQASVALSIGMMRYMGTRLRGLDQGRKPDDPLRKDLNNIKRVLAKTKKSRAAAAIRKTNSETKMNQPTKDSQAAESSKLQPINLDIEKEKETGSAIQKDKEAATRREKNSPEKKRKTKSTVNKKTIRSKSP
jgi:hypothetical protein